MSSWQETRSLHATQAYFTPSDSSDAEHTEYSDQWVREQVVLDEPEQWPHVPDEDFIDAYLSNAHATHERKEYDAWVSATLMCDADVLTCDAGVDGDGDFVGSVEEPKPFVLQLRARTVS